MPGFLTAPQASIRQSRKGTRPKARLTYLTEKKSVALVSLELDHLSDVRLSKALVTEPRDWESAVLAVSPFCGPSSDSTPS